jgi:hypothetical protein
MSRLFKGKYTVLNECMHDPKESVPRPRNKVASLMSVKAVQCQVCESP